MSGEVRRLILVLGDQLDRGSPLVSDLDPEHDVVLMAEVAEESTHVASHRQRTILFLAAMRRFAADLRARGAVVRYVELDDPANTHGLERELRRAVADLRPAAIRAMRAGEWRVQRMLERVRDDFAGEFEILEDPHFLLEPRAFADWAKGRRTLTMEHFYRMMRRRLGILVEADGAPEGGAWNYDAANRRPWRGDRAAIPAPRRFAPDATVEAVRAVVARRLPDLPGRDDDFGWPIAPEAALTALDDFIAHRLPRFGDHQDAMVQGAPWMFHALLAPAMNLKLLDPRVVVARALDAWRAGAAPLNAVEGFVRQVIGWREFVRGVYWLEGPDYGDRNGLDAHGRLPELYWTGETEMNCLRRCVGEVLDHAFGHHIQRLMVTGNFALLAGVTPRAVADWYLGMYADGVDWVTAPNVVGMALHADGGVVGTKPYASTGAYVHRMSDYCRGCRFDPRQRTGPRACPFTTLYWDFLDRHRERFARNPRMALAVRNLDRIDGAELERIRAEAASVRVRLGIDAAPRDDVRGPKAQREVRGSAGMPGSSAG